MTETMIMILTRILEVCIGLLAIVNFRWSSKGKGTLSANDLLKELEGKEREIERLKMEVQVWKKQYHLATNTKHLH